MARPSLDRVSAELARERRLKPDSITRWKRQFPKNATTLFERQGPNDAAIARIAEFEQALGRKTMELEIAKKHPAP